MAKVVTQTIVVTVSKLVKDSGVADMVTPELIADLDAVAGELIRDCVVEVSLLPE